MDQKAKRHLPATDTNVPSKAELESLATEEAYNKGVKLGYWK
jgi:hypothetical protein